MYPEYTKCLQVKNKYPILLFLMSRRSELISPKKKQEWPTTYEKTLWRESPQLTSGTPAWHGQAQYKTNHDSGGNPATTMSDIKMSDSTVVETTGSNRTSR